MNPIVPRKIVSASVRITVREISVRMRGKITDIIVAISMAEVCSGMPVLRAIKVVVAIVMVVSIVVVDPVMEVLPLEPGDYSRTIEVRIVTSTKDLPRVEVPDRVVLELQVP